MPQNHDDHHMSYVIFQQLHVAVAMSLFCWQVLLKLIADSPKTYSQQSLHGIQSAVVLV